MEEGADINVLDARGIDPVGLELVEDFSSSAVAVWCRGSGEVEDGGTGQGNCDSVLRKMALARMRESQERGRTGTMGWSTT